MPPSPSHTAIKTVNTLMIPVFLLAAAVQFDDPDWPLWVSIYLAAALNCVAFLLRKNLWPASALTGLVAAGWSASLVPKLLATPEPVAWSQVFGQVAMKTAAVEFTREIIGLIAIALWMAVLLPSLVRQKLSPPHTEKAGPGTEAGP